MQWYALTARDPADAARRLRRDGFTAYCPHERITRRRGRKAEDITRPIWPGYFFAHCHADQLGAALIIGEANDFIRYTDASGVRSPLRMATGALVPIILAEAFGALDHTTPTLSAYRPAKGDRVRITSGQFAGYMAKVITVSRTTARADVDKAWRTTVEIGALEAA